MSTPEIKPQEPLVQERPEHLDVPQPIAEQGVVSTPAAPQQATVQISDNQQVTTTAVPAPANTASVTLPSDPQTLQMQSQGDVSDSSTWFAVYWLRVMKQAIKRGIQVLTGAGGK